MKTERVENEKVLLVELVQRVQSPDFHDDLRVVCEMLLNGEEFDAMIDFSNVSDINSSSFSWLLKLRKALENCEKRLVLFNVSENSRHFFEATGLDGIFEFAENKERASIILRAYRMGVQWVNGDNMLLVELVPDGGNGGTDEAVSAVIEMVNIRGGCDVLLDFLRIDILTPRSISRLLKLRKLVSESGHKLVFFNVAAATKGLFTVTGLEGIFEVAKNGDDAMRILKNMPPQRPIDLEILENENISIAHLVPGGRFGDQFKSLNDWMSKRSSDLVIDFSCVDVMGEDDLTQLVKLDADAQKHGRRLVLFGLADNITAFFAKKAVDDVFETAKDEDEAISTVRCYN